MAPSIDRDRIQRILLVRLSAVGDVVNTLPAVSALRAAFPKAHLAFVVEDKAADLVVGHPDLDEVIVFPKKRWKAQARSLGTLPGVVREVAAYVRRLRALRADVLLDFQANLKGGLHARFAGVPLRIGFARAFTKECDHWFTNVHVTLPEVRIRRAEKFLSLLRPLGVEVERMTFRLPRSEEAERAVLAFLRSAGCADGGYALFHPGTSVAGAEKRWPTERFAELARRVQTEFHARTIVAWGPGERGLAEEVARGSNAVVAMETRSLLELAELARRARVFVGADSGPLHLACAVGTPSVALFGPKDPAVYAPAGPVSRVVHKPGPDGRGSMLAITVDDAFEAVCALAREPASLPQVEHQS